MGNRVQALLPVRQPVGEKLRLWREKRGLSQLRLGAQTGISTRHLSYVETGRSAPSRELIMRLADHLEVPPRERNDMLLAAGYAPAYQELAPDPAPYAAVHGAVRQVLDAFAPIPALAVDRTWDLVAANDGFALFTDGVAGWLLERPVNVLRLSLHPEGLAARIVNLASWRADLLARLRRRAVLGADPNVRQLYEELLGYPGGPPPAEPELLSSVAPIMPLVLRHGARQLALTCAPVILGGPDSPAVAGLAIKCFLPADPATAAVLAAR